jgi:hypothetical protein
VVADHGRALERRDRQTGITTRQVKKPEGPIDLGNELPVQHCADRLVREVIVVNHLAVYLPLVAERSHRLLVTDERHGRAAADVDHCAFLPSSKP